MKLLITLLNQNSSLGGHYNIYTRGKAETGEGRTGTREAKQGRENGEMEREWCGVRNRWDRMEYGRG